MARKRKVRYVTRRERFRRHARVYRLVFIFGLIFLLAWLAFFWRDLYNWFRLYTMN